MRAASRACVTFDRSLLLTILLYHRILLQGLSITDQPLGRDEFERLPDQRGNMLGRLVRRELGLSEARIRAADPKLYFADVERR